MDQTEASEKMLPLSADSEASADSAFEPTIDELVNDFDDEQTLNEEEALAATENPLNNPFNEIEALREEGEMPLEELLAKYAMPPGPDSQDAEPRKKKKKTSHKKHSKNKTKTKFSKSNDDSMAVNLSTVENAEQEVEEGCEAEQANDQLTTDCILIESGDEEETTEETLDTTNMEAQDDDMVNEEKHDSDQAEKNNQEKVKIRRSHLFELYPDQNFDDAIAAAHSGAKALDTFYSEDDEEEDVEEEEENDPDYVKKTIMVGSAFQAVIPGLSQYGDVLPYENEDKLVWEPSQVSEAEVEEYLLKVREIKPTLNDEESSCVGASDKNQIDTITTDVDTNVTTSGQMVLSENDDKLKVQKENTKLNPSTTSSGDTDVGGVVKDNEQALHLLVQCGYDFKEALRRKRLNAVPLTGGTMSLWSEQECQKFEEGIQKFGKDFLKIRQNQVRTRTMRELVQFYYLWKKSERRDHNFANADTVDHMDIYLNEGEDYSTSPGSAPLTTASATTPCRKINGCNQNNFSIMTGSQIGTSPSKVNNGTIGSKKRTLSDSNASNIQNSGNAKNNGANNSSDQNVPVPLHNSVISQQK